MADRDIRYCTTEDGVGIAYCVEGDGETTIVALPAMSESFSLDHLMPVYQQFYRDLGDGRRIVRFDYRGAGLSDAIPEIDGEAAVDPIRDLEAVARQVAGGTFVLWAPTTAGPVAIRFAAAHPECVSHLLLYGTFGPIEDAISADLLAGFDSLARSNWQMAMQTIADMNGRREFPEEAAHLGEWYALSQTADTFLKRGAASRTIARPDVVGPMRAIRTPTLVLHRLNDTAIPVSAGRRLAAEIPGARFVPLQEAGHLFCLGNYRPILAAVDSFVGDRDATAPERRATAASQSFRTVLFTDLVDHSETIARLGDEAGRKWLREHESLVRTELRAWHGTEVKTMGDGFLASFPSASTAVRCSVALQQAVAAHNEEAAVPIRLRIGIDAGEPVEDEGDLFGITVIRAARILDEAAGGEILVSEVVHSLCAGKGLVFLDRGMFHAKGIEAPVRYYQLQWQRP